MNSILDHLEKKEQDLYFQEYLKSNAGKRSGPISKNFGKVFYELFETDFASLTNSEFHFQKLIFPEFHEIKTTKTMLPQKVQNLLKLENKSILDFGTGTGEFCGDISKSFPNSDVMGVDLVTVEMGMTEKYCSNNCNFLSSGGTSLPFGDKSYDIITSFLVLEHIHEKNIDKLFFELGRVARCGFIFQISHGPANKSNMRRTSKKLEWWYNKISKISSDICLYYLKSDDYKWGKTPEDLGLSRWICAV